MNFKINAPQQVPIRLNRKLIDKIGQGCDMTHKRMGVLKWLNVLFSVLDIKPTVFN
jgi:hypothetical protein